MVITGLMKKLIRIALIVLLIIAAIYFMFVRSWILRMGVTDEELNMSMPGDGLVSSPSMQYIQAITISAPKEKVWDYLIQVGYKRAGWYNWDFINGAFVKDYFYENNKSADRIIPELQNLKQGDKIYLAPPIGLDVSELNENSSMLLTSNEKGKYMVAGSYMLKELDVDKTRLYVRWTSDLPGGIALKLLNLLITEPGGAGIQQSQMLKGIKQRAEADYSVDQSTWRKP